MIALQNDYLRAEIEDTGAQLCSLTDLKNRRELIWKGNLIYWAYHAPVLFPFVGTCNGNEYRFEGNSYSIGQHGFARVSKFSLIDQTADRAVYALTESEQTKEVYPFDFRFVITQSLIDNRLIIEWDVENPSTERSMYFQVGAHPAFNTPAKDGETKNDCSIYFPGKDELTYILKDPSDNGADPSKEYTMKLDNGYLRIRDHLFDIDTFIFDYGQIEEASICGKDGKPYVTVRCKGFPNFGIWSKSDEAPFVCLEPWYGRLDNTGFKGELQEKTGIIRLGPGEQFHAQYEIIAG